MKKILIAIIACLALSACSSQYYNGTHKSHPKHTCQDNAPETNTIKA